VDQERLTLLKAEIEAQVGEIEKIFTRIEERSKRKDITSLESLAYQIHNLYCAFEDLFRIVADHFENNFEEEKRYHRELLRRMAISIEGIRPAFLSKETYKLLDFLRAFRHFFRHAYTYELDPKKMVIILEDSLKLKSLYSNDIVTFLKKLGA